jgi:hypothetical protein
MPSSSDVLGQAFRAGWRRVIAAPLLVAGIWLSLIVIAIPATMAVRAALRDQLGSSLIADRVAAGPDKAWWDEFLAQATGVGATVKPSIIGAAAPLSNISDLVDGKGTSWALAGTLAAGLAAWLFLSGGAIDRLARNRPLGTRVFFGACGVYFFRFLRLGLIVGLGYLLVGYALHGWLFDRFYPWITRETTAERVAFLWRVALYVVWLAPVTALNIVADYAKVRAVLEDRHSMVGALVASVRFVRRQPLRVVLLYLANTLVFGLLLSVYVLVARSGRGGDWHLLVALLLGQAWILGRISIKLAFLSTATALFERRLAHAEFASQPLPVWPDSPAAEAIENAARFGVRSGS